MTGRNAQTDRSTNVHFSISFPVGNKHQKCTQSPYLLLTPSMPWCHLKTTNKSMKFETLKPFCFLFCNGMWKNFHQNAQHWKYIRYKTGNYIVFEAHPCIFQPGHFTSWGSEGLIEGILKCATRVYTWKPDIFSGFFTHKHFSLTQIIYYFCLHWLQKSTFTGQKLLKGMFFEQPTLVICEEYPHSCLAKLSQHSVHILAVLSEKQECLAT